MGDGKYAINKNPNLTYVSQALGKDKNIRYVSKVFDLNDFKDFYFEQKSKKVFEVIRENSIQEVTAIYNQDTTGFSINIQRFSKKTGRPHCQSFSFHGGALVRFVKFLTALDLIDMSYVSKLKISDHYIDEIIERKKAFSSLIKSSDALPIDQLLALFNKLGTKERNMLFEKFLDKYDDLEADNLNAALKQKEYKRSIKILEQLLENENKDNFLELVRTDHDLCAYAACQPEKVFHKWIENNLWVFGAEYYKKHPFRIISDDKSEADLVLETADGYLSLIEVKRPELSHPLLIFDKSHRCYFPASRLSEAIGQCLIYIQRLENYKKTIEPQHSVVVLRPRVQLIIGRSANFSDEEKNTLHFLNSSLHNVSVLTYDQLLSNANKIISFYDK